MSVRVRVAIIVVTVLASWTPKLNATLILTYRNAGEVIIAADSVRNLTTKPGIQVKACKILNFGDIVFTAAGATTPGDGEFSIESITKNLHKGTGGGGENLNERINELDARVIAGFEKLGRQGLPIETISFQYVVAFIREGQPVAQTRILRNAGGKTTIGELAMVPENLTLVAGLSGGLHHPSGKSGPDRPGAAAGLEWLITHQATRTPKWVGGPIDIVRLTNKGVEWHQRKRGCRKVERRYAATSSR